MNLVSELARKKHFSCGHKYENTNWSDEKNKEVFGSCFSEHGHGHNYLLEAFFSGSISEETGMIINLVDVDNILNFVTDKLDHKFLNTDVAEFKDKTPTTENIALFCFTEINKALLNEHEGVKLTKVRLHETDDLWVDVLCQN